MPITLATPAVSWPEDDNEPAVSAPVTNADVAVSRPEALIAFVVMMVVRKIESAVIGPAVLKPLVTTKF